MGKTKRKDTTTETGRSSSSGPPDAKAAKAGPRYGAPPVLISNVSEKYCTPKAFSNELRRVKPNANISYVRQTRAGGYLVVPGDAKTANRLDPAKSPWGDCFGNHAIIKVLHQDRKQLPCFIIRNVEFSVSTQEVEEALQKFCIPYVKVIRITSATTGRATPLVRVLVQDQITADQAVKAGYIYVGYFRMPVEAARANKTSPVQCYRCQGFGHYAANCSDQEKCVRCGVVGHNHKSCTTDKDQPKCPNCGGPHSGAYPKCPRRSESIAKAPVTATADMSSTKVDKLTQYVDKQVERMIATTRRVLGVTQLMMDTIRCAPAIKSQPFDRVFLYARDLNNAMKTLCNGCNGFDIEYPKKCPGIWELSKLENIDDNGNRDTLPMDEI